MIKLPKYLQEKIYVDIREANQANQTLTIKEIIAKYKSDFENKRLKEIDIVNSIKAIKKWIYIQPKWITLKYPPLNKPRHQRIANYIEKQKNIINENNDKIENQNKTLKQIKEKQEKIEAKIECKEAELIGYDQAMYLQKRFVGVMKSCKCQLDKNYELTIQQDKEMQYDLLDVNLLMLAIKSFGEIRNGSKVDFSKLFFDILKESDKATMFLQQNNFNKNDQELDISADELGQVIKEAVKELK